MKQALRRVPLLGSVAVRANFEIRKQIRARTFRGSATEWEAHYIHGGTSGPGSYGAFAAFKAAVINDFVATNNVGSVIEFGCGDGNQLSLADYPQYVGLDVSRTAIIRCVKLYEGDPTKSFFVYDPAAFVDRGSIFSADLALSLDVIFHLVEDAVFEKYMADLFSSARRFVLIYASDRDAPGYDVLVRHRQWSRWVEKHAPSWEVTRRIPNPYPFDEHSQTGSYSDFYVCAPRKSAVP